MTSVTRPGLRREHHDAIGQIYRLFHAVGNEQDRARIDPRDPDQLLLHHHSGLGIERAERLVHQQHLRLDRVGAGDGDALLHAARKLVRVVVLRPRHSHEREIVPGQLVAPRARHSLAFEPECDVLAHASSRGRARTAGTPQPDRHRDHSRGDRRPARSPRTAFRARPPCAAASSFRNRTDRRWREIAYRGSRGSRPRGP